MTARDVRKAFERHRDAVFGFAYRLTGSVEAAEDLAQDCFLELLRRPEGFDGAKGTVRTYLLGVVRNLAWKRWRVEGRLEGLEEGDGERDAAVARSRVAELAVDTGMAVAAAVGELAPLQREAIVLFEYEGLTLEEIAAVTGADAGTIKSRLHRGRERLRYLLAPLANGRRGR